MVLPDTLALFPLNAPLLPGADIDLVLFEQRYIKLMRERADHDPFVGIVMIASGFEVGDRPRIRPIGTAASLTAAVRHADERCSISLHGTRRFRVLTEDWSNDYLVGKVRWFDDARHIHEPLGGELAQRFVAYVQSLARLAHSDPDDGEIERVVWSVLAAGTVDRAFQIAAMLPLDLWQKQALIETVDDDELVRNVIRLSEIEAKLAAQYGPAAPIEPHVGRRFSPN